MKLILLAAVVAVVCAQNFVKLDLAAPVDVQPEGLTYSSLHGFIVSSLTTGTLRSVSEFDGSTPEFSTGGGRLVSTVGIHHAQTLERIYITNHPDGHPLITPSSNAELVVVSAVTGELIGAVSLSGFGPDQHPKIANDVAVHPTGEAFVSDSLRGAVYRVDVDGGQAEVLVEDERFLVQDDAGVGINGIVYYRGDDDEDQFLIAARSGLSEFTSGLYRIDIRKREVERIRVADQGLDDVWGLDGLDLDPITNTLWASSAKGLVYSFTSDDDWVNAQLTGVWPVDGFPTSIEWVQSIEDAYVVLDALTAGPYAIQRVKTREIIFSSSTAASSAPAVLAFLAVLFVSLF